jgi:flagellar basal-body rod protein FlgB
MTDISQHFNTLGQAIQFAHESHRVTSQNLANVNTPHYQTQELSFQQFLSKLETGSESDNMNDIASLVVRNVDGLTERADGNNVDLERELALLKKNSMAYQTLTQLLGSKMGIIQRSMTG